jgi:hypothetical protein
VNNGLLAPVRSPEVHTIAENLTELLDSYEADDGNPPLGG